MQRSRSSRKCKSVDRCESERPRNNTKGEAGTAQTDGWEPACVPEWAVAVPGFAWAGRGPTPVPGAPERNFRTSGKVGDPCGVWQRKQKGWDPCGEWPGGPAVSGLGGDTEL